MTLAASLVPAGRIFPGLRPFEEDDARLFFGRDAQVDGLLRRLGSARFLAIVGLSGSGKSSLVRAGLLPALRRGHLGGAGAHWRIAVMRPGGHPIIALAEALDRTLGELEDRLEILRSGSLGLLDASREGREPEDNMLLVVDQFEEIYRFAGARSAKAREAAAFVEMLLAAVHEYEAKYRVYVVLTMRSDYLGESARFPGLPEALNESQYLVPRMTREELREAIEGPAALGGVGVEPQLVDRLLEKTGSDPDELPILQHLLMRMWEVRESPEGSSRITTTQLEQAGGWEEALTRHANEIYELLPPRRQEIATRVLQRLTEKGAASRESRRPTPLRELAEVAAVDEDEVRVVVEHFRREGCNFLTSSDPNLASGSLIDISHESLIRRWTRLRAWAAEEAESGEWYRRVEDAQHLHEHGKKGLLIDPELASALQARERGLWNAAWAERYSREAGSGGPGSPGPHQWDSAAGDSSHSGERLPVVSEAVRLGFDRVMGFLDESQGDQDERRWLRRIAIVLAVVVLSVGPYYLYVTKEQAARGGLRAASAEPDPLARALLLSRYKGVAVEQDVRDYQAAASMAIPLTVLRGPALEGRLIGVFFIGDGKIATVSETAMLRVWNGSGEGDSDATWVGSQADGSYPEGSAERPLTAVAFSSDGRRVAVGLPDGSVRVVPTSGSADSISIPSQQEGAEITALGFSPDGHGILAGYSDYQARLWTLPRVTSGSVVLGADDGVSLGAGQHKGPISSVAFHPDGDQAATASLDRTVRTWRLRDPAQAISAVAPMEKPALSMAYSPDGEWLLCAYDDVAVIWPGDGRGDPTRLEESVGEGASLTGAWFSPAGSHVVTALSDGSARIWALKLVADGPSERRLEPVASPRVLAGHSGGVNAVAVSTDGASVVTASADATARVWSTEPREPRIVGTHGARVESVEFSSDGERILSASDDQTARIWTVDGSAAPVVLAPHGDWVRSAAFGPDGTKVATASEDGHWRVWALSQGGASLVRSGRGDSPALNVAFGPAGRKLVVASRDNTARIWDLERPGKPPLVLEGHDNWVWDAAFSPKDGKIVTASADQKVWLWDAESAQRIGSLSGHRDRVLNAVFSPDGFQIVTACADSWARVFRETNDSWIQAVSVMHGGPVNAAAFSRDSEWIVTASEDKTVRIWGAKDGLERLVLRHPAAVRAAAFSPDASLVVTGGDDGRVRLWRVTLTELADYLEGASTACLAAELRTIYLGESTDSAQAEYEACQARYGRPTD